MSELQKVVSKVMLNYTYTTNANYWAPHADKYDSDDKTHSGIEVSSQEVNNISNAEVQHDLQSLILVWIINA